MRTAAATAIALLWLCACTGPGFVHHGSQSGDPLAQGDRARALDLGLPASLQTLPLASGLGSGARALAECLPFFPASARSAWHAFDGEFYYLDAAGRPSRAYAYLPPLAQAPRRSSCQAAVGRWGDDENPDDDYDGGHMIGSQLGGFGGRLNLVPQDLNFNRGNWAQIENKMAECRHLPESSLFYYVRAAYADAVSLVPERMTLIVENRDTRERVWLTFDNVAQGGADGTEQRTQVVEFLDSQGCRL